MKDFTVEQQKRELKILAFCLILAEVVNLVAIIGYKTEWKELYTQIWYVVVLALVFYVLQLAGRIVWHLVRLYIARRHERNRDYTSDEVSEDVSWD